MKKILIYRHCSLGDFIVSLPAIRLIRKLNPNSIIYFASLKRDDDKSFVTPNLIPLDQNYINNFIFFEYNFFSICQFLKKIRKHEFDELYYLNEISSLIRLKRDELIFSFLNIKKKFGFEIVKYNYNYFNETYYLCKRVNKRIKYRSLSFLEIFKQPKKNRNYITISMGGRNIAKKWPHENWINLIKKIQKKFTGLNIYILGTHNDFIKAEEVRKINTKKIYNMCDTNNIKDLFKIVKYSQYHISHDDGTMHVASCFEKRGVSLFGLVSTRGKWFPINKNLKIFYPKKNMNELKLTNVFKKISFDLKSLS
jgi:ADP-heptose:LPS heptosyltransferase